MTRSSFTLDSLHYYLFTFGCSALLVYDLSFFSSTDNDFYPSSKTLVFYSASLGLLFRLLTCLPADISVNPILSASLQDTNRSEPTNEQASDPMCIQEFQQAQDPFTMDFQDPIESETTWFISPTEMQTCIDSQQCSVPSE